MIVQIKNVGQFGIVSSADVPPHELALNTWSDGRNVRMRDGMVEKFTGHQVVSSPTIAPYFLMPVKSSADLYYWLYAGLNGLKNFDGALENDIKGALSINATALRNWTGGVLGGVAILNNGVDAPISWTPGSNAVALANWQANYKCGAMRIFRRYLIAMDVTKSGGTRYPQMVKWSDAAPVGAVPGSWDETDQTKDAGEYEIKDSNGAIVDACRLRDHLVLYKEDSAHWMQYVGNVDVFKFPPMFGDFGILSRRCAVEYNRGLHAVFALGDLIKHDGQSWTSIIESRMRKWLFNQIDQTNYATSFVTSNPSAKEVWFCFPSQGNTLPNLAVVWNWKDNTIGVRELNGGFAHITLGNVSVASSTKIWDNITTTWDAYNSTWKEGSTNPSGPRLMMADVGGTKLQWGDSTTQFAGVNMTAFVERTGLGVPVMQDGPPDFYKRKFITNLWPRILGTTGGVVNILIGTQDRIDGPIAWDTTPRQYIIGTTRNIDIRKNSRLLCLRFYSDTAIDWRMPGYDLDVASVSDY